MDRIFSAGHPKFQVVLDEDTNLEGEIWAVHTKDTQVSHYGRVWDVRTGRKYFPPRNTQQYCCGEYTVYTASLPNTTWRHLPTPVGGALTTSTPPPRVGTTPPSICST